MTEPLIEIVRTYIEDEESDSSPPIPCIVSDAIIERWLNDERHYVNSMQIYSEDYNYDNESLIYHIDYKYLTGVVLKDGDGNVISEEDYTIDVFNGIITFDDPPVAVPSAVFATFNYHNFFEAVAELWKYQAAKARISGKAKLGDEDIPMGKESREYCIMKYWDYKQSRNIQLER